VAVADGAIAGFVTWLTAGDAVEVQNLFVDPTWMGKEPGGRWC
jgi:hypothetical protein